MDWRNEDSDYSSVENFMWEDKTTLAKSRSDQSIPGGCNVCSQGVQVTLGGCRESRSFTSAFDRLELGTGAESKENMLPLTETQDAQTCPCAGCLERHAPVTGFRTREISSLRLVIQGPEILNYQGIRQAPEDVAPYWKKDSRMWLWKSVRLARRKRIKQKSPAILRSWSHDQESIK
ncbi:uncharacterized protein LOC112493625 [Cephus cinctus]|uniref:Uncharacterized protein LOC112493625 n=1 Tax=Cephus cinctus TaxID=211228 RepID=A0AAJ7VWA6_CEPCN|nr:uncharacterized protein LOC112493625 [Cephus cinctus]